LRKILFLDFDGVLHADGDVGREFCRLPHLDKYLEKMPDIEIVISSSWRDAHSLEELKEFFPLHLREKIIGVTPSHPCGFESGGRQREIEEFLEAASLSHEDSSWVALDDMEFIFDSNCRNLVLVNANSGFSDDEGRKLLAWYEQVCSE
jgi:hypothetical protein